MTDGLAMGSPVSPIVANIFMDDLERNALVTMKDRPRLWLRYVDDVLSIVKRNSLEGMLVHLNAQNDAITFTKEDENEGKLPFLDGEIARKHARLTLTVYRKPTHSGRYLNFASHHPISAKCSTADSLFNRAESIVTEEEQKEEEFRRATQELLANDYPPRFIARRLELAKSRTRQAQTPSLTNDRDRKKLTTVVMPFVDGVSQPIQRVLKPLDVRVVGKPAPWKWSLQHENRLNRNDQAGVVYRLKCNDCERCISARPAAQRISEPESMHRT